MTVLKVCREYSLLIQLFAASRDLTACRGAGLNWPFLWYRDIASVASIVTSDCMIPLRVQFNKRDSWLLARSAFLGFVRLYLQSGLHMLKHCIGCHHTMWVVCTAFKFSFKHLSFIAKVYKIFIGINFRSCFFHIYGCLGFLGFIPLYR